MKEKWWHNKIAYQIYPKSFKDSNQDGIGDINGIIEKLDYLKDLGIDIIWISPMFQSPMADNGYDISDYYKMDPQFGTNEEMDQLIKEADKRGMKILMDLVINHSSNEHVWFQKALDNPNGKEANYYIFKEGKDGNPPNNWRSLFGGSAWEQVQDTNRYYLHIFAKQQPDLNWENEELREELYKMVNYWLDKGLGGFRVDAITYIKKDLTFADTPVDGSDGLSDVCIACQNAPGIETFLTQLKEKTFQLHDSFTVGEADGVEDEQLKDYIGDNGFFSTIFDFSYKTLDMGENGWNHIQPVDVNELKEIMFRRQAEAKNYGFMANVLENHDIPRIISKYIPKEDQGYYSGSMLGLMYFMLRGIPFLYQGQEIGMLNCIRKSIEEYDDISTHDQYQRALKDGISEEQALAGANHRSRDHSRTPMQWDNTANAGFTTGTPWLWVNPNYTQINVKDQQADEKSLLSFYKKMIKLRKSLKYSALLTYGDVIPCLEEYSTILAYKRVDKEKELLVITNYSRESCEVVLPKGIKRVLVNNYDNLSYEKETLNLEPYQAVIVE